MFKIVMRVYANRDICTSKGDVDEDEAEFEH